MTFNFSQDVIFSNALLQIKCGVKKFALNLWLAPHHNDSTPLKLYFAVL